MSAFSYLVEQEFGFVAKIWNITTMGIRHNKYSSCYGAIKYFDDKLLLRGKKYNMFSTDDITTMLSINSNVPKENIINRVFGHFFDN